MFLPARHLSSILRNGDSEANKQAVKQASSEASKQRRKQASKQSSKQGSKEANEMLVHSGYPELLRISRVMFLKSLFQTCPGRQTSPGQQ